MKPTVLTFVSVYLPGYKSGGPVRTIANLVEHLGDKIDFRIVTSDRDKQDFAPYAGISVDSWNKVGKAQVFYASPKNRSMRAWAKIIATTPHDVLYLNSFFNPVFTLRPLLASRFWGISTRPVIVAPRGEFSKGALKLKRWKKVSFIALVRAVHIYRNVVWQASSQYESEDIRRTMGRTLSPIIEAPDLPPITQAAPSQTKRKRHNPRALLRLVFLSRITPKKNLDFIMRVLKRVSTPVNLSIYGFIDDTAYWRRCQTLMAELPVHIKVTYGGEIAHSKVGLTLASHDLFFFPTRGENYGHVIHEALAAGIPVLVSDQTPWRDLDEAGVGWVRALEQEQAFIDIVEAQARVKDMERHEQSYRCLKYAQRVSNNNETIERNRDLFVNVARIDGSV